MSGHLYTLRQQWRQNIGDPSRTLESPSSVFIRLFGKTAQFQHTGVDCDHLGRQGSRHYHGQMYAVFSAGRDKNRFPMSGLDLESLSSTLEGLPQTRENLMIINHLRPQLAKATSDMEAHRKTFAWLNPQAALHQQIA